MPRIMFVLATMLSFMAFTPVDAQDFQKSYDAYLAGDYATALKEWRPLAEQGNAETQHNLGYMYDNGKGVPQDYAEAVKWYRLAADQGAEDAGQLTVAGVPVGDGFLPLTELTRRLLDQGLRRFTYENVWAYSAPIQEGRKALNGVNLGEGAFAYLDPPFSPAHVILQQSAFSPQMLVDLEFQALHRGHEGFRRVLRKLGTSGDWDIREIC